MLLERPHGKQEKDHSPWLTASKEVGLRPIFYLMELGSGVSPQRPSKSPAA